MKPRALLTRVERAVALGILHSPPWVKLVGGHRVKTIDGRTLDAQFAAMIELDERTGPVEVARFRIKEARARVKHGVGLVEMPPPSDGSIKRIEVQGAEGKLKARLYVPDGLAEGSPLIVYFHGGGWVTLDLDTHESFCRHLAKRAKVRVISVDYRLAPECRFPGPARDAVASFVDVARRAAEFGADAKKIAIMGDSAGGNLSAVVAQRTAKGPVHPALQVLLYPALDATFAFPSHRMFSEGYVLTRAGIDWYLSQYAPAVDRKLPELSPIFGEVEGVAPALIYTAGFDPLRDEAEAYSKRLAAAGIAVKYREFPSLVHGFGLMRSACNAARIASEEIADEVGKRLSGL